MAGKGLRSLWDRDLSPKFPAAAQCQPDPRRGSRRDGGCSLFQSHSCPKSLPESTELIQSVPVLPGNSGLSTRGAKRGKETGREGRVFIATLRLHHLLKRAEREK